MTSDKCAHPFSSHFVFPGMVEKFLALSTFFLAYSTLCLAASSATSPILNLAKSTVENLILTSWFFQTFDQQVKCVRSRSGLGPLRDPA